MPLESFGEYNPLTNFLECLNDTKKAAGWFAETFAEVYSAHKASEIEHLNDTESSCLAYQKTFI